MGVWSSLFGGGRLSRGAVRRASDIADVDIGIASDIITIPSRDFFGISSKSPNGRFTIAWSDGGPDQSRIGRYIVLDQGKVTLEGKAPRPNDGKVADSGVFIFNEWGPIQTLSGTLRSYRPDGSLIFARRFKANLFNNGLSADGRWAVCQTCNAPDKEGGSLFVFDLASGTEIACWRPESGWANSYQFAPDGQVIHLGYPSGDRLAYSIQGVFIDRMKWLSAGLQRGDIAIVETLLSECEGQAGPELVALLLPAIDVAIATMRTQDEKLRARALKLRGVCLEAIGQHAKALATYDQALALDPRVGVKRRADQLRKVLRVS